jgi:uncharacterized 2Fe-2S/4Fe-4S cluster protein (DUF4445 family)
VKIIAHSRGEETELQVPGGVRLFEVLQQGGVPVNSACGGNGTCHKCRIRVEEGFLGITSVDRLAFRESELKQGWRLSCQAVARTGVSVFVPGAESVRSKPRLERRELPLDQVKDPLLVCDLGSTGVVVALVDKKAGFAIEAHLLNKQVPFGADVMTRLHSAQKAGLSTLRKALGQTLRACVDVLLAEAPELVKKALNRDLICAGNSAMTSFLQGWPTDTLAVAPFQPSRRDSVVSELDGLRVRNLPLLAGFVGGDTVAGILVLEKTRKAQTPWMLVDIGTNTEIVIDNGKGELWFSSAPAGPAFEGGNINQGMRAETGAVSRAWVENGAWRLETIGGDVARGICGSGLIDILAEAVKSGKIKRDGFVENGRLDLSDSLTVLADDIREFQLAKSATRTAADLLIQRAGVKPEKIYLAGAFAQHLRLESVAEVGLLPPGIPCEAIGNASLEGAFLFAAMNEAERLECTENLETRRQPVELALQDDFQEAFVRNLNF